MNIKQRIISEQDVLCIYAVTSFYNKAINYSEKYSDDPELKYYNIRKYILESDEILEKFSVNNLFYMLGELGKDDIEAKEKLRKLLREKILEENFFCTDLDTEVFLKPFHSVNSAFNKLDDETIDLIKNNLRERADKIDDPELKKIIFNQMRVTDIANFLYYYEKGDFTKEKLDFFKEIANKSENELDYINFGLFQDDIYNLGQDFIEYLAKFPTLSAELVVLYKSNPDLFKIFSNRVNEYNSFKDNFHEIEMMITAFTKISMSIKINSIDKNTENDLIEWAVVTCSAKRTLNLITMDYVEGFVEKLNKKYDEEYFVQDEKQKKLLEEIKEYEEKLKLISENETDFMQRARDEELKGLLIFAKGQYQKIFDVKKNIYMNKRFSMSLEMAEKFIEEYGSDVESINFPEEKKRLFYELKEVLEMEDLEQNIDKLYRECKKEYKLTDILKIRTDIAKEFAKDYFASMNKVDKKVDKMIAENNPKYVEEITVNGKTVKQLRLNGKFDMLVHSSDAGFVNSREIDEKTDFAKQFKKGNDKANHMISATYINQDFLGCAPVNNNGVMYAFTGKNAEAIKLMGVTDINTYMREFAYDSATKQYMSAKTLPYNSRRVYSEVALEREGVTPDYIILFDDMSEEVKNNTYKAAADFDIPVLYIDKKEIETQQLDNLDGLIQSFKNDRKPETLKTLINTYETNVAGWLLNRSEVEDTTHTASIDNSRFKEDFEKKWDEIHDVIDEYLTQIREDKNQESVEDLVHIATIILEEHDLYEKCEETKPISKTHLSFDASKVLQEVNDTFDELGATEMKVDLERLQKAEEYKRITMDQIARKALETGITDREVQRADKLREKVNPKENQIGTGEINDG